MSCCIYEGNDTYLHLSIVADQTRPSIKRCSPFKRHTCTWPNMLLIWRGHFLPFFLWSISDSHMSTVDTFSSGWVCVDSHIQSKQWCSVSSDTFLSKPASTILANWAPVAPLLQTCFSEPLSFLTPADLEHLIRAAVLHNCHNLALFKVSQICPLVKLPYL